MNNFRILQNWLSSLSQVLKKDLDSEYDQKQVFTILCGEDVYLSFAPIEENDEIFIVAGPLFPLTMDPDLDEAILKAALKMNFLGSDTGCGSLGLSVSSATLVLAHRQRYDACDEILLGNLIQNMASDIARLRDQLSGTLDPASSQSEMEKPGTPITSFVYV